MDIHLVVRSANSKTGPMPVSTSSRDTCPVSCALYECGCYGEQGPISIHWNKVNAGDRGVSWNEFLESITNLPAGTLWRHNQVGDLPHIDQEIDREKAEALVASNRGRRGFTFTHHDVLRSEHNRRIIRAMNKGGFTVNLSADSLSDVDLKVALKIGPVVTILPKDPPWPGMTPAGHRIVLCLNVSHKLTCLQCGLCQVFPRRSIIGFPVHGSRWKLAEGVYHMKGGPNGPILGTRQPR